MTTLNFFSFVVFRSSVAAAVTMNSPVALSNLQSVTLIALLPNSSVKAFAKSSDKPLYGFCVAPELIVVVVFGSCLPFLSVSFTKFTSLILYFTVPSGLCTVTFLKLSVEKYFTVLVVVTPLPFTAVRSFRVSFTSKSFSPLITIFSSSRITLEPSGNAFRPELIVVVVTSALRTLSALVAEYLSSCVTSPFASCLI